MSTPMKKKVMIVDDEAANRLLLRKALNEMGHKTVLAENAIVALKQLDRTFDLILLDVMMPEMNGLEMVGEVRSNPEVSGIPIVMVTTLSEKTDRLKAVKAGANDFITKPVDLLELQVRVESMLKQKAQQDEIANFQEDLLTIVEKRTFELRRALQDLDSAHVEAILHLSAAAEFKDDDTASHIGRMSCYSELLAEKIGLDQDEVKLIKISSPMHDVGKIGITDSILLKPGKLDPTEWKIMKTHTTIGGQILGAGASDYMNMGTLIALSHHEKWDGSGYPSGLAGEDIPLAGRICAVADVFDALLSKRPYKEPFPLEKTLRIMKEGYGTHFDPDILAAFLDNMDEVLLIRDKYGDGYS